MRLELDGIDAGYGDAQVLRDVSLVVPDGSVIALLGPNGAGKTTTLNVASGLLRPRRGQVHMDGDITDLSPHERSDLGLCHITESGAVFPGLTVADNLRMFSDPASDDGALDRVFAAFPRLGERSSQFAGTLSGGEQRMLALARAYARTPDVVLVDEISMGLAPIIVDEIFEHLGQLAATGTSLLVVEQYVRKVLAFADLAYVLVRGRITYAGEPDELLDSNVLEQYLGAEVGA